MDRIDYENNNIRYILLWAFVEEASGHCHKYIGCKKFINAILIGQMLRGGCGMTGNIDSEPHAIYESAILRKTINYYWIGKVFFGRLSTQISINVIYIIV